MSLCITHTYTHTQTHIRFSPLSSLRLGDGKGIPFEDRQAALGLLLELALQRGTLQHMLDSVLLLLRLSDAASKNRPRFEKSEDDVPRKRPPERDDYGLTSGDEVTCPLVPFLRRLGGIQTPPTANLVPETTSTVSCCIYSRSSVSGDGSEQN